MLRLRATSLQCNPHLSVINDAGQLSNDAGMILPIEFTNRIHLKNLIRNTIFFNDERKFAKISFVDLFEFTPWIIHLGIWDMKSHLAGLKATFGALRILTERRSW